MSSFGYPRRRLTNLVMIVLLCGAIYSLYGYRLTGATDKGDVVLQKEVLNMKAKEAAKLEAEGRVGEAWMQKQEAQAKEELSTVYSTTNDEGVDVGQTQFLDYLNGEEVGGSSAFGGSLPSSEFNLHSAWKTVHAYALGVKSAEFNRTEFREMGRRARALRIAYVLRYDRPSLLPLLASHSSPHFCNEKDSPQVRVTKLNTQFNAIIDGLTTVMYPWLVESKKFKSIRDVQMMAKHNNEKDYKGIIFSTGRGHFQLAIHVIMSLRKVLGCTLPIEVHHMGPNDLDKDMIQAFNAMPDVTTVDVWDYWGQEARDLRGWAVKPFALLASRFTQVMFIDADSVFLQDPNVLFTQSEIFAKYGQIFYHDRTITGHDWCYDWFNGFVPSVSQYANSLRFQKKQTVHEQESGVIVVDKSRSDVLHGLMTTCKMNMRVERDGITYKLMHGDKESYWMSWELARIPYKFSPSYGGTIGYKNERDAICGGLFHTDEYLRPLWWNGGVVANKHVKKNEGILHYEYFAYDMEGKDISWEWETSTTPFCLKPKFEGQKVVVAELSAKDKENAKKIVQLYNDLIDAGWKEYLKTEFNFELKA